MSTTSIMIDRSCTAGACRSTASLQGLRAAAAAPTGMSAEHEVIHRMWETHSAVKIQNAKKPESTHQLRRVGAGGKSRQDGDHE